MKRPINEATTGSTQPQPVVHITMAAMITPIDPSPSETTSRYAPRTLRLSPCPGARIRSPTTFATSPTTATRIMIPASTSGTGDTARTHVVVRAALVTDIDNESGQTIGSTSTVTVTLALTSPDDVLEAAHASQVAAVTLVRATKASGEASPRDVYAGPDATGAPADPDAGADTEDP